MTAGRPQASRSSSLSHNPDHRPAQPSGLRQAYTASPPSRRASDGAPDDDSRDRADRRLSSPETSPRSSPRILDDDIPHAGPSLLPRPVLHAATAAHHVAHHIVHHSETTALLRNVLHEPAHPGPCNHGTFSPRAQSPSVSVRSAMSGAEAERASSIGSDEDADAAADGDLPVIDSVIAGIVGTGGAGGADWKRRLARRMRSKKMSTSSVLAEQAGFKDTTAMWVPPAFAVIPAVPLRHRPPADWTVELIPKTGTSPTTYRA